MKYPGYTLTDFPHKEREPLAYCPKCDFPCISKEELKEHFKDVHIVKEKHVSKIEAPVYNPGNIS